MHIADIEGGNLGANGIVAGGLPIAVGVGMSIKAQQQDRVCMVFFGDGAANEGAFHESLNMASIWKLPIVFVCENNKYAMSMDIALSMAVKGRGRQGRRVCDARHGGGWQRSPGGRRCRPHCGDSRSRRQAGRRSWNARPTAFAAIRKATATFIGPRKRSRCGAKPIRSCVSNRSFSPTGAFTKAELVAIETMAQRQIDDALAFAKASPDPDPAQLTRDVYAG
jgi:pyruvate dehydrogenase E1 component alpha subunit